MKLLEKSNSETKVFVFLNFLVTFDVHTVGYVYREIHERPQGWLHFYLRQKRNEWFTFATHARKSRGGPSPRSRALIHISPSCGCTQWVAPRAQIAQPRSGRAIRVVEREPRLALSTWRRHRMLSE